MELVMMYMKDGDVQTMKLSRRAPVKSPAAVSTPRPVTDPLQELPIDETFEMVPWPSPPLALPVC